MRRRLGRRRNRIQTLQELLAPQMTALDDGFYLRLKESFLNKDDKSTDFPALFDRDTELGHTYYKNYPTIYHLRKELMESDQPHDFRLVYLALHHILRYRGHFLYEGQNFSMDQVKLDENLVALFVQLEENLGWELTNKELFAQQIAEVLTDAKIYKSDKAKSISGMIGADKEMKTAMEQIAKAMLGYTADYSKIFLDLESNNDNKFSLSDDEADSKLANQLGESFGVFEAIYKVYSNLLLNNILDGEANISKAMVKKYEQHGQDLEKLKKVFRDHFPNRYSQMFRNLLDENNKPLKNYANYVIGDKKCNREDLSANIQKILKEKPGLAGTCPAYDHCIEAIKRDDFLKKINSKDNGAIPYQCHLEELRQIFYKQGQFYPILQQEAEHIQALMTFRIPYYVGPLNSNPTGRQFAWMERKVSGVKIYPWNFDDVVDKDQAAEAFILRMTNKCTYLPNEDVLPKYSLLYAEYELLNELNKIRVNDKLLDKTTKNKIIEDVFKRQKTVKEANLRQWLKNNQVTFSDKSIIEGYQKDKEFAGSLTAYLDFSKILGVVNQANSPMIEEVIRWVTIFTEKDILKRKIKQKYPAITDEQCKQICKLRYTGWGRLSQKLLAGIKVTKANQQEVSIIDCLRETNKNFMQIINDDELGFKQYLDFSILFSMANVFIPVQPWTSIDFMTMKWITSFPSLTSKMTALTILLW